MIGSAGREDLGTLGQVRFARAGGADAVSGSCPVTPPAALLFPQADLSKLLRLVETPWGISGYRFDPCAYIRIVNALQPLGKERALAAISEYLRVTPGSPYNGSIFLVLRILFDVPDTPGYMPRVGVGAPEMGPEPADPRSVPRFPIVIVDDVPFLVVEGYDLCGRAQRLEEHVEYFREHGTIRARPLRPPDRALDVMADLRRSRDWIWSKPYTGAGSPPSQWTPERETEQLALVRDQWLRLVDSIYHIEDDFFHTKLFTDQNDPHVWSEVERSIAELGTRWNPALGLYTLRKGSYMKSPRFARFEWTPTVGWLEPRIELYRRYADRVSVDVVFAAGTGDKARLLIYRQGHHARPIATQLLQAEEPITRVGITVKIRLPRGEPVRLVVEHRRQRITSPVYKP
jgi:hypothetical protein